MKGLLKRATRRIARRSTYQERAFGIARRWSNRELARFGHLFEGDIINVSAWEDRDKEGKLYKDYFPNRATYSITNYGTSQGALQHSSNEVFLDLEKPLPTSMIDRYDLVLNHTTLEHVYDFQVAFSNMCAMSRDAVVVVVPWMQPLHSDYGDYWRFSPQALPRMFDQNGMTAMHIAWNDDPDASVYILGIAVRDPVRWSPHFSQPLCDPWGKDAACLPKNNAGRAALRG